MHQSGISFKRIINLRLRFAIKVSRLGKLCVFENGIRNSNNVSEVAEGYQITFLLWSLYPCKNLALLYAQTVSFVQIFSELQVWNLS